MKPEKTIHKVADANRLHAASANGVKTSQKTKTPVKNIFSKASPKVSPHAQFSRIRKSLQEVEEIEAGIVKPKSLDDILNEL